MECRDIDRDIDQEEVRFLRFLELRRLEKRRIQEDQEAARSQKQRKLQSDRKQPGGTDRPTDGRRRGQVSVVAKPKAKDIGASLDMSIDQAMQEQERDKLQQQFRHTKALKSCLGTDGNVRTECMSNLVKLMEQTTNPRDKIPILQVLETSALDPDSTRWTRFMEVKGMNTLKQWLTKLSASASEGDSDKIVCGCLNVLRRLPLSLDRARAEGLFQVVADVGSGRAIYIRRLANELIHSWQAADGNGAKAADSSEDSDLESVEGGVDAHGLHEKDHGDLVSRRTAEQLLPASDSVEEAETQKTLQGLMELGKLLGGQQEAAPEMADISGKDATKLKEIAMGTNGAACSAGLLAQQLPAAGTDHEVDERDVGESSGEESSDDDPLVTPMLLPSNLREHRWDGYTPDPLMCAISASPSSAT